MLNFRRLLWACCSWPTREGLMMRQALSNLLWFLTKEIGKLVPRTVVLVVMLQQVVAPYQKKKTDCQTSCFELRNPFLPSSVF